MKTKTKLELTNNRKTKTKTKKQIKTKITLLIHTVAYRLTHLNAMNGEREPGVRSLYVVLKQCVEVDLLDAVNVTGKQ